jgi:hypothetical protein
MKSILARLFIGANNQSGIVELDKALAVIDARFNGYTVHAESMGVWNGKFEKCRMVDIIRDASSEFRCNIIQLAERLREELQQEAIGVAFIECDMFFV